MLPEIHDVSTSLSEFKNAIKPCVSKNCSCRLCKNYVQGSVVCHYENSYVSFHGAGYIEFLFF